MTQTKKRNPRKLKSRLMTFLDWLLV